MALGSLRAWYCAPGPVAAEKIPADGVEGVLAVPADLISGQLGGFCQGGVGGLKKDPLADEGLILGRQLIEGLPQELIPLQPEQEPERVLAEGVLFRRALQQRLVPPAGELPLNAVAQDVFGVAQHPPLELTEPPVALQVVVAAGQGLVGDVPIVPVAEEMPEVGALHGCRYGADGFFIKDVPGMAVTAEGQPG